MSTETNNKIFIGSTSRMLDNILILGDNVNSSVIVLFQLLLNNLNYALLQYNNGNEDYLKSIKNALTRIN